MEGDDMSIQTPQQTQHSSLNHLSTHDQFISILAHDGMQLKGIRYNPVGPVRGSILLNAGTGIPQKFYTGFASYLAERGYGVLTYDYRGVGESRPSSLAGYRASKMDWGKLDMTAAFSTLQHLWPEHPHYVFGHSVGGQLLALMENNESIDAVATYGSGYGYWGNLKGSYRYFVGLLWYVGIPVMSSLFRYVPASKLGLGEDLPSGVARDWARWGKRSDYFTSEIGKHPGFQNLRCKWKAFLAEDDDIATPGNALPLYEMYPNIDLDVETLDPEALGARELGHLRFFSRSNRDAWHIVADWFDQQ
jgi:predicted alpha/beta hydrolase